MLFSKWVSYLLSTEYQLWARPNVIENQDILVQSNSFHRVKDRFWLKKSYRWINRGIIQWVWNSLWCANLLERAKKLIHYDTTNNMHKHIQKWPISNACGMLPPVGRIMGGTLLSGHFQHLKNDLIKKITCSYMISTNVLGRNTYYNIYASD
jgi:hypothetical protein